MTLSDAEKVMAFRRGENILYIFYIIYDKLIAEADSSLKSEYDGIKNISEEIQTQTMNEISLNPRKKGMVFRNR